MLPDKYHFGVIVARHQAEVHTLPFPEVGPEDVVIKLAINNICTTDYQQWMGLRDHHGFPNAGGHEYAGTIVAKGEKVLDDFQIGQQVGAMMETCGVCENCRRGLTADCLHTGGIGVKGPDGYYSFVKGFANYMVANQKLVVPISNDVPPEQAAFLEPVSTVINCVKRARIQPMEDVVVIGAGTMGILNAQVAKAWGARVIITEVDPNKLERARSMGIADVVDSKNSDPIEEVKRLTKGKGADVVIAAVGATIAYKQGYDMLKQKRGRLIIFPAGYPKPELHVDPNELHYRKMEIIGVFNGDREDWLDSARLISNKMIDCSYSLQGVKIPLRDIQKAYELAATPGTYRVSVDLQEI